MSDWLMKVIRAEAARLIELSRDDLELRSDLIALAESILRATAQVGDDPGESPSEEAAPPEDSAAPAPRSELTLGRSAPPPDVESRRLRGGVTAADDDVHGLVTRCQLKAEAARVGAESAAHQEQGVDESISKRDLDEEQTAWLSRLVDGYYWSSRESSSTAMLDTLLEQVAGCFQTVAEALNLAIKSEGRSNARGRALEYLAEAQSALREALRRVGANDDADQCEVFEWLHTAAARHRVFLRRHMRADDPADPTRWQSLLDRVEEASAGAHDPRQARLLDEVRRLQEAVLRQSGPDAWPSFVAAVEALIATGLPPSNRALRALLLPVLEALPDRDDYPPGFRLALREIDRFRATRQAEDPASYHAKPSPEVEEVARLLAGRSLVLIGGLRHRGAQEAIKRALALESVIWIETREHESFEGFEPMIARPEVAVVLLAIRWSSHGFGEVRHLCDRHGKPLVRLPGGYGPNQVAAQILAQCGRRLDATASVDD